MAVLLRRRVLRPWPIHTKRAMAADRSGKGGGGAGSPHRSTAATRQYTRLQLTFQQKSGKEAMESNQLVGDRGFWAGRVVGALSEGVFYAIVASGEKREDRQDSLRAGLSPSSFI